jgi:hypothetical protein
VFIAKKKMQEEEGKRGWRRRDEGVGCATNEPGAVVFLLSWFDCAPVGRNYVQMQKRTINGGGECELAGCRKMGKRVCFFMVRLCAGWWSLCANARADERWLGVECELAGCVKMGKRGFETQ